MNLCNTHRQAVTAIILAGIATVLFSTTLQSQANSGYVDKEARRLYVELMSPFCPGLSLAACTSGKAELLRIQIRERLDAGESSDDIVASLVAEYGKAILAAPPNRGFGRLAWIGPIAMALAGVVVIISFLRRRRARTPEKTVSVDPAMRARLENEIKTSRL